MSFSCDIVKEAKSEQLAEAPSPKWAAQKSRLGSLYLKPVDMQALRIP